MIWGAQGLDGPLGEPCSCAEGFGRVWMGLGECEMVWVWESLGGSERVWDGQGVVWEGSGTVWWDPVGLW